MITRDVICNVLIFLTFFLAPSFFDLFFYVNGISPPINSTLNNRDWPQLKKSNDQVSNIPTWVNGSQSQNVNSGNRRDFVNTNIPSPTNVRTNQNKLVNTQFISSQRNDGSPNFNTRRDYVNVNTNVNNNRNPPKVQQQTGVVGQQSNLDHTAWPQLSGRRDYVNTNPPPTWVRPTNPSSANNPSHNQNNKNTNVNARRDYVNPNIRPQTNNPAINVNNNNNKGGISVNNNKGGQFTTTSNTLSKPGAKVHSVGPTTDNNAKLSEDDELREFSETLLKKDVNNAAKYITVNYQSKTTSRSQVDEAPLPLLTLTPEVFNISTVSLLVPLHNNYVLKSNENEHVTPQEKSEENNLLDAILATSVLQHTRNFLIQKGKIGKDPKEFRDLLKQIWFNMYSRGGGKIGSSGFEHVFLAEIKNGQLSGLHNWLYFNIQELANKANYLGYLKKIDLNDKGAILKYHFKFDDIDKPVGSMFIGTSPELEIALYSTCFVLRPDVVCPLRLNGYNFIIRTYTYRYRGKNLIGSAFPEI